MAFHVGVEAGGLPKMIERHLEILRRIQIVLKEKLKGPFPGLAALAHERNLGVVGEGPKVFLTADQG
jgi:hypothetical protein